MDLSFIRTERDTAVTALPTELAVLLVGVSARQSASPTARAQVHLGMSIPNGVRMAPADGAFNGRARALVTQGQQP